MNIPQGRIYENSNFFWYEATKNYSRLPQNDEIKTNIIRLARYLDKVRIHLGNKPIIITSWYRDSVSNARVGGATRSQHLTGLAADFYCPHLNARACQRLLDDYHGNSGGLGCYSNFTHIDLRGYKARWHR